MVSHSHHFQPQEAILHYDAGIAVELPFCTHGRRRPAHPRSVRSAGRLLGCCQGRARSRRRRQGHADHQGRQGQERRGGAVDQLRRHLLDPEGPKRKSSIGFFDEKTKTVIKTDPRQLELLAEKEDERLAKLERDRQLSEQGIAKIGRGETAADETGRAGWSCPRPARP
jgi:hypothetical protein